MFCSALYAHPLNGVTDSLKKLIPTHLSNANAVVDTATIRRLNQLAYAFYESFPDSTTYYGQLEIKLAKKINDKQGIADGYVQVAPYASLRKTVNGTKNVYLINETVVTKTTKFQ